MRFMTGRSEEAFLMMHGGAGPMDPTPSGLARATDALRTIAYSTLRNQRAMTAMELATALLIGMEDDSQFNAGYGAALQADGQPRLSAALMDGAQLRFSGVISVSDMQNPSRLALALQDHSCRVLTDPGAMRLARNLGILPADLVTPKRFDQWLAARSTKEAGGFDTVGAVIADRSLVAGTSTGGRGFETPGRVSDSATVAGNYASPYAAISLTGIGEQIVDFGVAVRIETRVRDGQSLAESCERTYNEALKLGHEYGWIACDGNGNWCVAHTTEHMTYLVRTLTGTELTSSAATDC